MFQLPYFEWTTIEFGPISIQVWGMFVVLGILLSLFILNKRAGKRGIGRVIIMDLFFWTLIAGFIGARIGHILFYEPLYYLEYPLNMLKIWRGGFSSFGGFVGAFAGFFFYVKKVALKKEEVWLYGDELIFSALFGWIVARLGCVMIHDHWGVPCNCFFAIRTPEGPRYDMAFLEIMFLLPLVVLFFYFRKKLSSVPFFLPIAAIYYGILRFILDFFRATDITHADVRYWELTPAQYLAIVSVGLGVWILRKRLASSL